MGNCVFVTKTKELVSILTDYSLIPKCKQEKINYLKLKIFQEYPEIVVVVVVKVFLFSNNTSTI
jgi:hypothetical protein